MRHVACNLTFTASREEESKAIVKKQLSVCFHRTTTFILIKQHEIRPSVDGVVVYVDGNENGQGMVGRSEPNNGGYSPGTGGRGKDKTAFSYKKKGTTF